MKLIWQQIYIVSLTESKDRNLILNEILIRDISKLPKLRQNWVN